MRSLLFLTLLPLAGCSLSNALFNAPDFQQKTNQDACADFHVAFVEALRSCEGADVDFPSLDRECPARLDGRDPLCASLFDCRTASIICEEGGVTVDDEDCFAAFPDLRCEA